MRELTYFVAVSVDGFIAGPNGEHDRFLAEGDHVDAIAERFRGTVPTVFADRAGVPAEGGPFDTVLMGWNTYAVGLPHLPSPYAHLRQIVFTRAHEAPVGADAVECTDRDPVDVVRELKSSPGDGIWLCGGGALAAQLADEIDRLVLKISPVLFGDGIRLFGKRSYAPSGMTSDAATRYESGVVIAEYSRA
ncbi:dihydrofolate reductase [Microbacterium esteraromaticum]|uniref:Dihydrofolate reductase n=1 Tax=Microbacterium esteraromaticum TaxID=57043 RepID=A0A7D8A7J6_9MICO|nr:dihydrofolate reductase family protein [Microbacterium esteraromaticum]QMU96600.1 dihydrofolate reductase [Microbacterium esteraromaticum]